MSKEKYYKWVKASEKDLPTYKHIIREIASKKILSNTEIEQITKDNIYTCYGGIFSLEYYEWLKELSPSDILENENKAKKWDVLEAKISKFYFDKDGEELEDGGGDLCDIGEAAAMAFGFL